MSKTEVKGPGIPSEARMKLGPVACIECFQQIPCNPCEQACPKGAIQVGGEITGLPILDEEKCNGCGICMTRCPGLAIFGLDASYSEKTALVSFPYEYVPLPQKGQKVKCTDRNGNYVTDGYVHQVRTAAAFDHTAIVTVEIPNEYVMEVRFIDRNFAEEEPDEDSIYVCRCEEVTVGDIKRAIAEGAHSLKAIKMRTHAGMGVCQGMTCRKNIERMLREEHIDLDLCCDHSQRFPVRLLSIEDLEKGLVGREERAEHEN